MLGAMSNAWLQVSMTRERRDLDFFTIFVNSVPSMAGSAYSIASAILYRSKQRLPFPRVQTRSER